MSDYDLFSETVSLDEVQNELAQMVRSGEVFAYCDGCNLPLTVEEFDKCSCNQCGRISSEKVRYALTPNGSN